MSEESKHIALFIRYLPVGGIQKIVVRLANEFAKRGHAVDLIVAKGKGALASDVSSSVRIVDFQKQRVWAALPALVQYINKERPDVLFAAEAPINLVAIGAKLWLGKRLRLVVSVRSNMTQYAKSGEVWYGKYMPSLIKYFYPFADRIVTVSKGVLKDIARMAPRAARKGRAVYNPVIDQEMLQSAREPVDHPWLNEAGPPVILGVGRLTRQKNFKLLLRAFASVRRMQEVRLIILGDGNERHELEQLAEQLEIANDVCFAGFVDNPYKYMSKSSLFVLSSNYEGIANVLIEALACGCPVVSTDCPSGPHEVLEGGKWGRLVPVGDEEALAEAMQEALSEPHDPDRLRQRAMDFTVDKAVDNYLNVLFPSA